MRLRLSQFFKLFLLVGQKPLLIMPTINATKETMILCDSLFGKSHHKSNKANASRHAIWNYLLCQKSFKIIKNSQKSAIWAQKVANLYEKVTNNDVLDEFMDLHNNQIGRNVFLEQKGLEMDTLGAFFHKMSQNAVKISSIHDFRENEIEMIYIED